MTEIEFIDSMVKDKTTNCLGAFVMDNNINLIIDNVINSDTVEKLNAFTKYWEIRPYKCGSRGLEIQVSRRRK